MVSTPSAVRAIADTLDLGQVLERYRIRPMPTFFVFLLLLIVAIVALCGDVRPLAAVALPGALAFAVWTVLIRRNRAVYVLEDGVVLVNAVGRVRTALRWPELHRVRDGAPGYSFVAVAPAAGMGISTLQMPDVDHLAQHVRRRLRESRARRLAGGERVRFGAFEISPLGLIHHTPTTEPTTVPWTDITGVLVAAPRVIVSVSGGPDLAEDPDAVPDLELFVKSARQRIAAH